MDNSRLLGTKNTKLQRVVPLKHFMIRKIDESQEIKRLSRYYTQTPLLNKGLTYDGEKMNQPDLIDSLSKPIKRDRVSSTATGRILFNYSFSGEVLDERQISIYVHCHKSTFNPNMATGRLNYGVDNIVGKHFFNVDVIYATEINELESLYDERANSIACEILTLLDEVRITKDEKEYEFVGDCKFGVSGEITDLRLRTSGYMGITIPFYVEVFGGRVDKSKLGGETRYA